MYVVVMTRVPLAVSVCVVLAVVVVTQVSAETCACEIVRRRDSLQWLLCPCKTNWTSAAQSCVNQGGHLASLTDDDTQNALRTQLSTRHYGDTWAGGRSRRVDWHWTADGKRLTRQGCYKSSQPIKELDTEVTVADLTPQRCVQQCRIRNFTYAAVKAGSKCYCSEKFGTLGMDDNCVMQCVGNSSLTCGGYASYYVYRVHGAYSDAWGTREPQSAQDNRECVRLACEYLSRDTWMWKTDVCNGKKKFICQRDAATAPCVGENYRQVGDKCISTQSYYKSWFEARWECIQDGGDLLSIEDASVMKSVTGDIPCYEVDFWIGGTNVKWEWQTGNEMLFNTWTYSRPQGTRDRCLSLSHSLSSQYKWADEDCNGTHAYVCDRDLSTTTTSTITTTTTTTSTVLPTTTTTVTTTTTNRKSSAASQNTVTSERIPTAKTTTRRTNVPATTANTASTGVPPTTDTSPNPDWIDARKTVPTTTHVIPNIGDWIESQKIEYQVAAVVTTAAVLLIGVVLCSVFCHCCCCVRGARKNRRPEPFASNSMGDFAYVNAGYETNYKDTRRREQSRGASDATYINSLYGNGAIVGQDINLQTASTPTQTTLQKRPTLATQPEVLMKKVNNASNDHVVPTGGPSVALPADVVENNQGENVVESNQGGFIGELDDYATFTELEREDIV